jgi:lipid A 3-O-deacylase
MLALLGAGLSPVAMAGEAPLGVYVQAGASYREATALTVGVTGPWLASRPLWGGELSGYWDAHIGQWRSIPAQGPPTSYTVVGVMPMLRWRPNEGRALWFVDAGIGLVYIDGVYQRGFKRFSTRGNFDDRIGFGRNFGPGRNQEWSVQLQHVSNADARKPNPGENFVQVRYSAAF